MGHFEDSVLAVRAKIQQKKLGEIETPLLPASTLIATLMPQPSVEKDWEQTMGRLIVIRHILEWVASQNEGLYINLARLEGLCCRDAKQREEKTYHSRKRQYLSALGEICELYYLSHDWKDIEFMSPGLGMKKIMLCLDEQHMQAAVSGHIIFLTREFPFLVTFDRTQLAFVCAAKEAIPGSTVHMKI